MPLMRQLSLIDPSWRAAARDESTFGFGDALVVAPVVRPGARSWPVRLPRGRWHAFWDAVRFRERDGAFVLGRAGLAVRGRRVARVRAPLAELPMFVRAGTLLPLVDPSVDTLASYGAGRPGLVRLRDRRDRLRVLALPHGTSSARIGTDGAMRSVEGRGAWTFTARGRRARTIELEASLRTLRRPFRPCAVRGARRWEVDRATGVLRATLPRGRRARLVVRAC
jgi:hypothetical protein